jgi:hypothetical protein
MAKSRQAINNRTLAGLGRPKREKAWQAAQNNKEYPLFCKMCRSDPFCVLSEPKFPKDYYSLDPQWQNNHE